MSESSGAGADALPECDMIMKGGITSGVVYPGAIRELSDRYRFRGLGGASAGAIAAAMAGAAEYGRANGGLGFERLAELPADLGEHMVDRLQPSEKLQRQWTFLLGEIDRSSARRRSGESAGAGAKLGIAMRAIAFVARAPAAVIALVLAVAITLVLGLTAGGWAWAFGVTLGILVVLAGLAVALRSIVATTMSGLDENNFGFCDGHTPAPGMHGTVPLTDWLNAELGAMAGLEPPDVLTYAHLWGPAATQSYRDALEAGDHNPPPAAAIAEREIDLTMMVTNLGQGRAHKFPFDIRTYFWCPTCLGSYFDRDVITHMTDASAEVVTQGDFDATCPRHGTTLREMPAAPDMPVIVGVRISFSFPVLFSAVPLHTVDWTRTDGNRGAKICWFADGGIASNFPMHFFDALIPGRPTFGISLGPVNPDRPESLTHRPTHAHGWQLRVNDIDTTIGKLSAIADTMQNWQDRTLQTLPGYRDRVVDVRLRDSEGGLNLTMPAAVITELSERGAEAAGRFDDFDLTGHRWTRFRVAISQLGDVLGGWRTQWDADASHPASIQSMLAAADSPELYDLSGPQREALAAAALALADWAADELPGEANSPRPKPEFKTSPRL